MKQSKLQLLDRYLSVWIFLAMGVGIILSAYTPKLATAIHNLSIGTTSIPIAVGLLIMMYPPLAKVEFKSFITSFADTKKYLYH